MKATVKNIDGYCLVIDKNTSLDSMLFLEILASYKKGVFRMYIVNDPEKHCLRAYMNVHKNTLLRFAKYINDNSDNS